MFLSDHVELDYDKLTKNQEVEYYPPEINQKSPTKFDFLSGIKYLSKKILSTSHKDELKHLITHIGILGRAGNVKCFRLSIDYWEKDFDDETLISLATALASHESNEVQHLSLKDNSFSEKGLISFGEILCSFESNNQSLMYLDLGKRKDLEHVSKNINQCLIARFKRKMVQELIYDLKETEKILGEDPILIDKLNNIASIFWSISEDLNEDDHHQRNIKVECILKSLEYCEKSKKIYEQRYKKTDKKFLQNIILCHYVLNDIESAYSISGFDKNYLKSSPQWNKMPSNEEPIKILCLDGGGIRGLALVQMLQEIEKKTNKKLTDSFDLISGTSTGGLISLALFSGKDDLNNLRDLYHKISHDIFGSKISGAFDGFKNLLSSNGWYNIKKLETHMKEFYGEEEMLSSHNKTKMFVISAVQSQKGAPKPFLLKNYIKENEEKFDCRIWEAARATSAAPTYFSPININGTTFIGNFDLINQFQMVVLYF
jgi:hypothetical protein